MSMTYKKLIPLFVTILIIALLALSPFLPGPSFLSKPAKFFYSVAQFLSLIGFLVLPVGLWLTIREIRRKGANEHYSFRMMPVFLVAIPITLISCFYLDNTMRNFSRSIAIKQANKIIVAIESYRIEHNEYPKNLINLQPKHLKAIPNSFIIGIADYQYESFNSTYSLSFRQMVLVGLNYEVVTYNPIHEVQSDGETFETGFKHWSYYISD
ncbi:MAG: hypothetical protein ABL870_08515 [Sediminibacterium sp.]